MSSIILGYDPETLRERVDLVEVGHRLAELGDLRSRDALCEKAWLLKVGGNLDDALDTANEAYRLARFTGDRRSLQRPRMIRAQVLQYLGRYEEALTDLTACIEEAHTHEWHHHEAFGLQHRGKVYFDQGDDERAVADFAEALRLRKEFAAPQDQVASSEFALETAKRRLEHNVVPLF
ncbi:tetratricopeptide repeat protein [Gryllotalpicola ginsengisoli]|uniref:tetratricopeptide repeat protein n=1 Tax=Gryllotalpicola ginsengisoli TaxID=444608 RepID=UPI0003B31A42|nr:tetratricopeptide repeat protein [Gryllotalpicola ginsengisoli]